MKTFVVGFWPDYEELFFSAAAQKLVEFHVYDPFNRGFWRCAPKFVKRYLYRHSIKHLLTTHSDACFIFNEKEKFIKLILKYANNHNIHVLIRNPLHRQDHILRDLTALKAKHIKLWSFDRDDCVNFGLHYYNQFISPVDAFKSISITTDFTFVGRNKNRAAFLNHLDTIFHSLNKQFLCKIIEKSNDILNYKAYLQIMLSGKCLVDITQEQQSGLTLRPLEAAIYGRKLLSNNSYLLTEAFYHPSNILIISEQTTPQQIAEFMQSECVSVDANILMQYDSAYILDYIRQYSKNSNNQSS